MENIPSDKRIAEEIQAAIDKDNSFKQCICCRHYNKASGECGKTMMKMMPYVRGCNGKFFETAMEYLVSKTREDLKGQALECDKIENYLALSITTANATSCFFSRMHKLVKDMREKEKSKDKKRLLYKDLEMIDEMQRGMDMIEEKMKSLYKTIDAGLEEIDRLYRIYIEPTTNRLFTKNGRFDGKMSDLHLGNSFWFCKLLTKATITCFDNEENEKALFGFLDGLKNERYYALTHKDADSFELKN